jgi:hypothetical protein
LLQAGHVAPTNSTEEEGMRKALSSAVVLGSTVFREQIAAGRLT